MLSSARKHVRTRSRPRSIHLQEPMEQNMPDRINELPTEVLITIFEKFDVHTLLTCTAVCKSWFELGTDPYFSKKLKVQRMSRTNFPPLISWSPLEYYNLFSLASQSSSKELANYEFFNCSKYCDMIKSTEIGKSYQKAKVEIGNATKRWEGEVTDRMRLIKTTERYKKMRAGVSKMNDKVKDIYRNVYRGKIRTLVEDAKSQSKSMTNKFQERIKKLKQRFREFYQERTVGVTASYQCIGHQMRNFVLSSVLLQHVAFSVLLWRHWDKTEVSNASYAMKFGLIGIVLLYWILALRSMTHKPHKKKNSSPASQTFPQAILYILMSLLLVHMAPFHIVAFDFALLLLTIALATVSVFDIYHRLYNQSLITERSVLQYHLLMALQSTTLFLHLFSPPLVLASTLVTLLLTLSSLARQKGDLKTFFKFWDLQSPTSPFNITTFIQNHIYKLVGVFLANGAWIITTFFLQHLPFSLLHGKLSSGLSLWLLAAELTILHCSIMIIYNLRYPQEETREEVPKLTLVQHDPAIPPPPPLPARLIARPKNNNKQGEVLSTMMILHPTVYWHYVWILGVICDFLMGLMDRLAWDGISQSLSLVLPVVVLVAVLPIQIYYWNKKWNYDLVAQQCSGHKAH